MADDLSPERGEGVDDKQSSRFLLDGYKRRRVNGSTRVWREPVVAAAGC
jgi:hypothetical protein